MNDLSPLARLVTLESITVWGAPVRDLAPLAGLENLAALGIPKTEVEDVTTLGGLRKLATVNLGWGIRWSLPGDAVEQRCGTICDIRP